MPVTQRGWSLNSFALSKIWFRTKCVDLRSCDMVKMTSLCKSLLYQDMLAKPEEFILHRPPYLQTAANPKFIPNLLHTLLFKKHVLGEDAPCVSDPPPCLMRA